MPSLTITTRKTRSGSRYVVRYRLGGRAYPLEHGGSFKTLREAKARSDLIGGELAAGRNPRDLLGAMRTEPVPALTLARWRDRFIESRIDADNNTKKNYRSALKKACETFGDRDTATITADEVVDLGGRARAELQARHDHALPAFAADAVRHHRARAERRA